MTASLAGQDTLIGLLVWMQSSSGHNCLVRLCCPNTGDHYGAIYWHVGMCKQTVFSVSPYFTWNQDLYFVHCLFKMQCKRDLYISYPSAGSEYIYIYFFFFTAQTSFSLFWHLLHCISTGMAVFLSSGLNGSHPGGNPFNYVLHYMYLHKHRFSYTDIGYQPGWMSFELISISGIFY